MPSKRCQSTFPVGQQNNTGNPLKLAVPSQCTQQRTYPMCIYWSECLGFNDFYDLNAQLNDLAFGLRHDYCQTQNMKE